MYILKTRRAKVTPLVVAMSEQGNRRRASAAGTWVADAGSEKTYRVVAIGAEGSTCGLLVTRGRFGESIFALLPFNCFARACRKG